MIWVYRIGGCSPLGDPRGRYGCDILHYIVDEAGQRVGHFVYECKDTKTFGKDWTRKLLNFSAQQGGDRAFIVTRSFPQGSQDLIHHDDVIISSLELIGEVASVYRASHLQLQQLSKNASGTATAEAAFAYLKPGGALDKRVRSLVQLAESHDTLGKEERDFHERLSGRHDELGKRLRAQLTQLKTDVSTMITPDDQSGGSSSMRADLSKTTHRAPTPPRPPR